VGCDLRRPHGPATRHAFHVGEQHLAVGAYRNVAEVAHESIRGQGRYELLAEPADGTQSVNRRACRHDGRKRLLLAASLPGEPHTALALLQPWADRDRRLISGQYVGESRQQGEVLTAVGR